VTREPVTTLDQRFSAPGVSPTNWGDTLKALETAELSWLTTVRADGRPHVILTTGCSTWHRGLDVVVEGTAVRVTDDGLLSRLAAAWTTKWDGRWQYEVRDGQFHDGPAAALVFSVTPVKILAFGKGQFTHTRHRF
jgi:hypothetical protein